MRVTFFNSDIETAGQELLEARQVERLRVMLRELLSTNAFYKRKLGEAGLDHAEDVRSLDDLRRLPLTVKQELVDDQAAHPPFGTNLTFPVEQYIRLHQTSGTTGAPLRWLDTAESWDWWARCWGAVYRGAGVGPEDRVFFAFSFGPFIGFWSAWEGTRHVGALAISGGAHSSEQRLHHLLETEATTICCTPSYALHLAEVARDNGMDIGASSVQRLIVAGEPGANIPATRRRIEEAWNAQLFDHTGATEVGAHGFECVAHAGVHLNEGEFIVEVIDPATGQPADAGELVITNLGRIGMPIIRYRTGDQVWLARERCECGRTFVRMEGGIIGRIDDMFIVRGVNVFPSAIENIVRSFPQVDEFAIEVYKRGEMDELELKIEALADDPQAVARDVQAEMERRLALRVPVHAVEAGSLPRWELKARRVVDRRR
ncbi:MAG: phenylacetate--CoA ligase family protein [Anaerolineae bacterium]